MVRGKLESSLTLITNWKPNAEEESEMIEAGKLKTKMTFHNFEDIRGKVRASAAALRWINPGPRPPGYEKPGILFYGPAGTGKTHLANALGLLFVRMGIFTLMQPTPWIPRHDQEAVLDLAQDSCKAVILDDLGAEKLTDRAMECLYLIVDGRLRIMGITIVTTNYGPDGVEGLPELRERVGDRIYSRLRELCLWVPVGGEDMRERL